MTIAERLEQKSIPLTECGCVIWMGGTTNGYGAMRINGQFEYTHRLAWQQKHGPIPDDMFICHRCDIRCCVNPDHLFVGTDLDNIADMIGKGRHKPVRPKWKLTKDQVEQIKSMPGSDRSIARKFGVSHGTIARAKRSVKGLIFVDPSRQHS